MIVIFPPQSQKANWAVENTPIQENDRAYGPHSDYHQTCKRVSSLHDPLPRMPPKRSTNRSWSLDEARGQGVLLNVSVQKNTAGSPLASSAPPPPINGKEVSPVLDMQKLTIPAVCLPGVITRWRLFWEAPGQDQVDRMTLSSNSSLMFSMFSKHFIVGGINFFSWRYLHEGLSDNSTNGPIKNNVCWLYCNLLNFWPPWTSYLWKDTEFDFEWSSIYLVYKMQPITVILSVNR